MSLLDVHGLTLSIGGRRILDGVDLEIAPGEIVGLVGESGSGKSMTALALMRLPPKAAVVSGKIAYAGRDLAALSEKEMSAIRGRDIAMVFQEPMSALNPLQTIGAQIGEGVRIHEGATRDETARRVSALLERVGLSAAAVGLERYPHELSGGQRQRVVIAIAIAMNPKLLIADEPTSALDVTVAAEIVALLRSLAVERGMGLIFITHDIALIAGFAERIAVMEHGRIVEHGPARVMMTAPEHAATQAMLAAASPAPRIVRPPASQVEFLAVEDAVRDYRRRDGHRRAVDHVSMSIHAGETVGLVGESGSGKSTLGRMLLALESFDGGALRLAGRRLDANLPADQCALRRSAQIVFQDPYGSFNPRHAIARIVAEPMRLLDPKPDHEVRMAAARAMLERVGIDPARASHYPHEFSGGERQRIAIARALVIRPKLVVLDEAVSALDASIKREILALLASLSAEYGLAYLFITHDLAVVRAFADRVLVMKDGRIVDAGSPASLFEESEVAYTRRLAAAAPSLEGARAKWSETGA